MWKLRKGLQFALRDSNRVEVTTSVFNDSFNSWKKKKFPPNAAFVTSRNSPLPRKLWKTCASCQSNRKSSPARTILKTVLQFHFLEQLSLALENIAPFRKIYFFSLKNRIKLPYRKRGMIKRGRFLEKDCFLSLKKKEKNALHHDYYKLSKR